MGHTALKSGSSKENEPSRKDRKFEKKLKFYSKVKETVAASLRAKSDIGKKKKLSRHKKVKAYDFSLLTDVLPELKNHGQQNASNLKLNSKKRQKLVQKEGKQFKAVLSNPVFQLDPLAAIHQHLENTQPKYPEEKPKKKPNRCGSKKGKKSKAPSGQAMEI